MKTKLLMLFIVLGFSINEAMAAKEQFEDGVGKDPIITFTFSGGPGTIEGTMPSQVVDISFGYPILNKNTLKKEGYAFSHWVGTMFNKYIDDETTGETLILQDREVLKYLDERIGGGCTINLVAVWYKNEFEVSVNNGYNLKYTIIDPVEHTVRCDGLVDTTDAGTAALTIPPTIPIDDVSYTVVSIKDNAFYGCDFSYRLYLPNTLKTIGASAFAHCDGFTGDLTIPNSVEYIGNLAFEYCIGFNGTLTIGNSVKDIGSHAFYSCENFTGEIKLGNSIERIGSRAFGCCKKLSGSIIIPNSVEFLGERAFTFCEGIDEYISIGRNVKEMEAWVFSTCNFQYVMSYPTTPPTDTTQFSHLGDGFGKASWDLSLPEESLEAYKALETWQGFKEYDTFSSEYEATENLKYARYSGKYEMECTGFINKDLASATTKIPNSVFIYDIGGIKQVTSIGDNAFQNTAIDSITIPDGIKRIGNRAFALCISLEKATIGEDVETIGEYAFALSALKEITIPGNVEKIGNAAFSLCPTLEKAIIENGVETIGDSAFCVSGISSITIPSTIRSIGKDAFNGCSSLDRFYVNASNIYYSSDPYGILFNKYKTRLIKCGEANDVTQKYEIPESVILVEKNAFRDNQSLEQITIPSSTKSIGDEAFRNCKNLKKVILKCTTPPTLGEEAFLYTKEDINISIPCDAYLAYDLADGKIDGMWHNMKLTFIFNNNSTGYNLKYEINPDGKTVTCLGLANKDDAGAANLVIPETITYKNISYDVTIIKENAFSYCQFSGNLTIGSKVEIIEDNAFSGCKEFKGSLIIPNSVTNIGEWAFDECGFTGTLTIGNKVENIGKCAFQNCENFNELLTIPGSVTNIGNYAFNGCTGIEDVEMESPTPPSTEDDSFGSLKTGAKVIIPYGSNDDYDSVDGENNNLWCGLVIEERNAASINQEQTPAPFTQVQNTLYFTQPTDVVVYNLSGVILFSGKITEYELPNISGIYIIRTNFGGFKVMR